MDELVIAGRVGELVDHLLGDLDPVGHALGADPRLSSPSMVTVATDSPPATFLA